MYVEIPITRRGILLGGRAFMSRKEAIDALRHFLKEGTWERDGFASWKRLDGTLVRVDRWATL